MPTTILLSLLLAAAPSMVSAAASAPVMAGMDHAAAACPATPARPPAKLAGWARRKPVRAGASAERASMLVIGEAALATLLPTPKVAYAVRPKKPGGAISSGGMFAFTVAAAGRYRVALDSAAWIDVLAGTTPAASVAHGHGPECSGVHKMVDFDLQPGRYLLQVAGNGTGKLSLMVGRVS